MKDNRLYCSVIFATTEAVKHQPLGNVCSLHAFDEHLITGVSDVEFAAMFENRSSGKHLKVMTFVPVWVCFF